MTTEERIKKQRELIEEIGRYFDKEGMQPIAGRILGLLMVMDKELFTFEEITKELQISKSSASVALKNLEIRGQIEYTTLLGDRKRYFHLKNHEASSVIEDTVRKMNAAKNMFNYIIELKADKNSKNSIFLKEMIRMFEVILFNFNKSIIDYEKSKKD
ncbi:MAG: MarR family transcriptional regulator [Bacteroidales bacterium]|nr:MarR family transcriptional regulator [Bacteroidales bacterium]MBN2818950.1 MarR family transcriptional regulator [Bacteroidales bacterium]